MDVINIVGTLAAILSVSSFAPQAWRIIRTRETKGLSVRMYLLTVIGFTLWFTYGILLGQWPIIVPNFLCLLLAGFILMMLLLPRHLRHKVADTIDPSVTT